MWIVRLALRRPYTFVVCAILVAILGVFAAGFKMATDIFPFIDIPVISVIYQYTGMSPSDMEQRIVTPYERVLTTTVNDIEHIESQSLNGTGVVKIYFQPNAKISDAIAQVTAVSQTAIRQMPAGTQPPLVIQYSASNVPIIQLSLSSDTMPEQQMFDFAMQFMRPKLITVPGAQVPYPYGGKQRQIMVDLDPERMYARGISPADVSAAMNNQSLILPAGTVKVGTQEYQVRLNASPEDVAGLNDLPVKTIANDDGTKTVIYMKDIGHVRDGFQVQTNIVHANGKRGVLISILKNGNVSTLDVVNGIKAKVAELEATLPPTAKGLKITPLFDQSVFVKASIAGVLTEAGIAAGLTALMILLFLGSWRSTLVVVISIPLSILVSIIILWFLGQTLNTMTLGGMALAVGILVDDATVEIENIHRNLHMRKRLVQAILDGASQIAIPAFVSTLCICIVFVPVVFISGAARFLFTPLAMSVVFAMMTSYLLSRTLVPTMVHYLLASEVEMYGGQLDPHDPHAKKALAAHDGNEQFQFQKRPPRIWLRVTLVTVAALVAGLVAAIAYAPFGATLAPQLQTTLQGLIAWPAHNLRVAAMGLIVLVIVAAAFYLVVRYDLIWRTHFAFNRQFERLRHVYGRLLLWALTHRVLAISGFALLVGSSFLFAPITYPFGVNELTTNVGRDFFPAVDAGQARLHVRCPPGTRIEQTERYYARVQEIVRRNIPADEIGVLLDNMGIPNSGLNLSLSDGSVNAPSEGEVLVSLREHHGPTAEYFRKIKRDIAREIPDLVVWSAPSDIATQVLNFGLSSPLDVQISNPRVTEIAKNRAFALNLSQELSKLPGVMDTRVQQVTQAPDMRLSVDRTLAAQVGVTQRDVASDLLISLSSSNQTAPNFWLNPANGVNYSIFVQTPQYSVGSLNDLQNTPIVPTAGGDSDSTQTQLLGNLATISRGVTPTSITHYNIDSTVDVLMAVQDLDLGRVSTRVQDTVSRLQEKLPTGSKITVRGQAESMNNSFFGLAAGLVFAVVLVYLLMVINFQSWLDPMIILMALPGAVAGILWMLWGTNTPLSVPALMGAMMCVGVATANSILMITFANDQRKDVGANAFDAALEAGMTRLRPVVMTAAAMVIGMLPMSLGLGEGGEQNAPLGRAVIGGLLMATIATLFFVPVVYSLLRKAPPQTEVEAELQS